MNIENLRKTKSLKAKLLKRILPFVIIGSVVISLQGLLISRESTINTNTKLVTQISKLAGESVKSTIKSNLESLESMANNSVLVNEKISLIEKSKVLPISSSRLDAHTPDSTRMSNSTPPTATNAMVPVFAREDSVSSGSREAL